MQIWNSNTENLNVIKYQAIFSEKYKTKQKNVSQPPAFGLIPGATGWTRNHKHNIFTASFPNCIARAKNLFCKLRLQSTPHTAYCSYMPLIKLHIHIFIFSLHSLYYSVLISSL